MIDRSEVTQMSKFMAALNGAPPAASQNAAEGPVGDPAIAEMKTILERFHTATDRVVSEATYDRELREALVTEATENGARIGDWEIRVHPTGNRKLYDVVNIVSGSPLAVDLLLYEAARGLVRILNDGGRINSREAIELLRAEQEYDSMVHDMVLYKHRLTTSANSPRVSVFEARYGDAKRRALAARERVCRLADHG
jgi:hypothetical protein